MTQAANLTSDFRATSDHATGSSGDSVGADLSDFEMSRGVMPESPENAEPNQLEGALSASTLPNDFRTDVPIPTISRLPDIPVSAYRFELLQQWEGVVTRVGADEFEADLRDLTSPEKPMEEAVFPLDEVSEGDLELVGLGAVFRWSVGYRTRNGQKERVSLITFLRLPAWSRTSAARVRKTAAELKEAFPLTETP